MKKQISAMLAVLMLVAGAGCTSSSDEENGELLDQIHDMEEGGKAPGDEYIEQFTGAIDMIGPWESEEDENLTMIVSAGEEENSYEIVIYESIDASSAYQWTIHGEYDAEMGTLAYEEAEYCKTGVKKDGTPYTEDEKSTSGTFAKEGETKLRWHDSEKDADVVFVKA